MRKLLLILTGLLMLAGVAAGQDLAEKESRRDRLEKEISILESQLKKATSRSNNALNSLQLLQRNLKARKQLLADSDRQIRIINDSLYLKQVQINRIQRRLDTMTVYYSRLVKNAYKNRDAKIWYMYILGSENLGQAGRRYSYLKTLSTQMNGQARKIKESKAELEAEKEKLKGMKAEAQKLRNRRAAELADMQKEEAQSKKLVAQLKKDKTKYQKQITEKRNQVQSLNKEISRLIAAAMNSSKSSGAAIDYKLAGEFESNKGKLPWPANGPVVEGFGQHYHPVYTKVLMPFNNGVNIAVAPGTSAKAVFDGVVKQIIVMPGYGQCVLVQHGNYFTFYCKLTAIKVKQGQKITTGQELGRIDTISSETQLHFQLWKGKTPQDPEKWLRPRG
mgnify:CR=1 FL=1